MIHSEASIHEPSSILGRPGWLAALAFGIAGCAPLPPLEGPDRVVRLAGHRDAPRSARPIAPEAARHPGLTGIEPITDGRVALGMRLALLRAATRSIDIQTFIWHADNSGTLLYEEILRAAERGVRVRLLLDDVNTQGLDPIFALLDAQPNIELRLYNPFTGRGSRGARLPRRLRSASTGACTTSRSRSTTRRRSSAAATSPTSTSRRARG